MPVKNYESLNTTTDVTTTKTLLHEAIPVTGTIMSGVYGNWTSETNVKNYTHGMWQSQYDYPFLSSSANHIFDIAMGFDEDPQRCLSGSISPTQLSKKLNICTMSFLRFFLVFQGSANAVKSL